MDCFEAVVTGKGPTGARTPLPLSLNFLHSDENGI